jgi:hypothetical protein
MERLPEKTPCTPKSCLEGVALGLFVFCQTLLLYCLLKIDPFADPDSFWHIAAGDQIRKTGAIPTTDEWSFTSSGVYWYNLSWLWDVVISYLNEHYGLGILYCLTLCVYAFTISLQSFFTYKYVARKPFILLAAYIAGCLTFASLFLRPGMVSILFGVVAYQCLCHFRDTGQKLWLLPIPAMMTLWVNMHGGFLLCYVLIGVFAFEAIWNKKHKDLYNLILCSLICVIVSCLNPYGHHVYEGALRTLGSPLQNLITEWLPLNATSPNHILIVLMVLGIVVAGQFKNPRIPLADRVLAVVLVVAVVTSVRHLMLMSSLIIPYLSYCLMYAKTSNSIPDKKPIIVHTLSSAKVMQSVIGLSVVAVMLITYTLTPSIRDRWLGETAGFKQEKLLLPEIAFVEKYYPTIKFMNYYDLGGALIYSSRGKIPVFIDGREQTAYPPELIKDVMHLNAWQGWDKKSEEILDSYQIGGIIFPNNGSAIYSQNQRYKEVFKGPAATIFLRQRIVESGLIR